VLWEQQVLTLVIAVTSGATGIDNDVSGGRVVVVPRDVDDDVAVDIDNRMNYRNFPRNAAVPNDVLRRTHNRWAPSHVINTSIDLMSLINADTRPMETGNCLNNDRPLRWKTTEFRTQLSMFAFTSAD
jgi:hypothetical protein